MLNLSIKYNFSQPFINNSTQVDLGYHVDNATKQKIANGEYVILVTLLVRDANRLQLFTLSMVRAKLLPSPNTIKD